MNTLTTLNPVALEQLNECSELRNLESFFDSLPSDQPTSKKLWIKPNATHLNSLADGKIFLEAAFQKQGKKIKSWKTRYYILTSEFLAYKEKPQSKTIKKVMLLERVKLECIQPKDKGSHQKFGFKFLKNNKTTLIYTPEETVFLSFRKELDRNCILHSFKEKYNIEKRIGKGSFGKVYLVKRRSDGELFAAKMFFKDVVLKQKRGRESLFNEIAILKGLEHPGIVKLYEIHETVLSIFLVMELLEGGELFGRIKQKRNYSEKDCVLLLTQLIEPLIYLHDKGIMHRDIKPENLILRSKTNDSDIVIADFGLAQQVADKFIHLRCGTPGYCAPEILNHRTESPKYTTKCDVFSVGCVFYYLIVGKNPFGSKYYKETLTMNRECNISFDDFKILSLSVPAQDLLQKMLEKDPLKRPSFRHCLDHDFFKGSNRRMSGIMFSFTRYTLPPQNSREKPKESNKVSQELNEDQGTFSFYIGPPNMMRGVIETLNDVSVSQGTENPKQQDPVGIERITVSRSTFLKQVKKDESVVLLSPFKRNSSRFQDIAVVNPQANKCFFYDDASNDSSSHSENLGTANSEENDDQNVKTRQNLHSKVRNIVNSGMITNPFVDFEKINEDYYLSPKVNSIIISTNEHVLSNNSRITQSS